VSPVRWVWRSTNKTTLIKLIDDHDGDAAIRSTFSPFAEPLAGEDLGSDVVESGVKPASPGGLFTARYGDYEVSVVVGMRKVEGFGGLLVEPQFTGTTSTRETAVAVVQAIVSWSDARLAGAMAAERRDRVVARLKEHLFGVMCGQNWANAERGLRSGPPSEPRSRRFSSVSTRSACSRWCWRATP
jgi:hypothetical protein